MATILVVIAVRPPYDHTTEERKVSNDKRGNSKFGTTIAQGTSLLSRLETPI